jgi:hypothetical protein
MRATFIVFHAPVYQDGACFSESAKDLPVLGTDAQLVLEAFDVVISQD